MTTEARTANFNNAQPLKSKTAFVLFAVLLGCIGVHRFYMGDVGLGFLYLLFSWTGIPLVIALIEAVVIGFRKNDPRFK